MSIHRRVDGAGRARFQVRWREDGRQRSRTFNRRGDAEAWDTEVRRRAQLGPLAVTQFTSAGPTLSEWVIERWGPEHGPTLQRSTRRRYADAYRLHLEPFLGDVALRDLTVSRLRQWQSERLAAGVSAGTIDKCRTFLSSVLRHAAESEAIPGNPIGLVRPPKAEHRDAVRPLAPATVERIRRELAGPMPELVPEQTRTRRVVAKGGRDTGATINDRRAAFAVGDRRDAAERQRDALIVSLMAYAGLRPGEVRGLRWSDVREATLTVERAADDDGVLKGTKTASRRAVRLLAPLAADLAAYRAAVDPGSHSLVLPASDRDRAWTKSDWQVWRSKRWAKACRRIGLKPTPRPYDLRHSFASLLLAEGRMPHYVARQLGHSPTLTLTTYGHLFDEYADAARIDAEDEIRRARDA